MAYYPDQRYAAQFTIISRDCVLPEESQGNIRVAEGNRVDIKDVVAAGTMPSAHVIIDGLAFFGLKKPDALIPYWRVEVGDFIDEQDLLAAKNPKRGKRLFSPVRGRVMKIEHGRIILQKQPEQVEIPAGLRGRVSNVVPGRSATIEATGAQVQGIWGNNRRTSALMRVEEDGTILQLEDEFSLMYKGVILVTQNPIGLDELKMMQDRGLGGIIAPSMDIHLRQRALDLHGAVLLTEGFGKMRMSRTTFNLFGQFDSKQVTIDTYMPTRWETRYPQVIVNISDKSREEQPTRPNPSLALRTSMNIRITREPYLGQTGRIKELYKTPTLLTNGLRVLCAQVELIAGETVIVPLTNLEVLGR